MRLEDMNPRWLRVTPVLDPQEYTDEQFEADLRKAAEPLEKLAAQGRRRLRQLQQGAA